MDKRRRRGGWTREEEENGQENKRRKVDSIKRRGRRGGEGFGTHYFVKAFLTLSLKQKIHCCVIYLTVWRRIPLVQSISIIIRRPHKGSNKSTNRRLYGRHQWLFPSPFRSQDKTDTDLRFLAWGHKKKTRQLTATVAANGRNKRHMHLFTNRHRTFNGADTLTLLAVYSRLEVNILEPGNKTKAVLTRN